MTTQNKIFSRVLGPQGILRRRNTTVILATHASRFLRYTDYVVVLSDKGTISEQGSFDELVAAGGYISPGGENAGDSIDLAEEQTSFDVNLSSHQSDAAILQTNDLAPDKARQTGDFTVYRYYFSCLSWKIGVMFLIFQVSYAFLTTFPAIWLKWWADSNTKSPNKNNTLYIGVYAGFQVSALISSGLVTWWSFHIMAAETGLKLHQIIVKTVMTAPLTFFSATDSGTTLTRFSQDIQLLDMSLPLALQVVVSNAMICTAQIGLIASASAWLILSFPALFIVFYFVQKYYLRTSRQMRLLDIEEKAPLYTHFTETLEGLATIRAFSWKRLAIAHSNTLVDRSQKPFYLMYTIQRWLSLVLDLIIAALAVMVVGVSVGLRDTISSGFTGVSLTQIISFSSYLKLMVMFWTQMETSIGAVARIRAFASETPREENNDEVEPPEDWPSRGEVKIMNASARYRKEEEATALSHINLAIKPGEKVGICGRTGSGKSSLVLTLFRMLDLCDGQICIDGQDIATLTRESVRRQLAVITDAPFIMPGTIRHNLDPDGYSTDDKITVALKKSQIWDAIDAKGGLDADMEGCKLSLGQKQLFNIAGAILKKSGKVLVMDEATSRYNHSKKNPCCI
jgi:ATP-binding cassette subfamily C (CFTR/MRP) protein 1